MSELLRFDNVTKYYGGVAALKNVNVSIEEGKIYGLLGPNGSGKTTFIKLVCGLLTPSAGQISILGNAPGVVTKSIVSYLPDNNYLNSWMRVEQIVDQFKDFFNDFREDAACRMLEGLGIDRKAKLKNLSKGNKEKVCLILTMSREAKLYVLDEPIAGVDPATRDYIISTIIGNYDPSASVVISTHLISDIEQVLDEVIFIQNGEILLQKEVDAIREENGKSVDELFREVFRW